MDTRVDLAGAIGLSTIIAVLAGLFAIFKVTQVGDFGDWGWWAVTAPLWFIPVVAVIVAWHHAAARARTA
jgi:hypothetical protein